MMHPALAPLTERTLSPPEQAIASSVLYAALFDYPLTLSQLRQTLIESRQTPSEIVARVTSSGPLAALVEYRDGFFFPAGRGDLVAVRRSREQRSRAFLAEHRPLLRLIAMLPYVSLVALSGSVAHLNLETGGDLDLFIVTRGRHVWSTAVAIVLLAKLLGRRRTLCANYIVADDALQFESQDLFTANQVINLKPIAGAGMFRLLLAANPFVRTLYPNFHAPDCSDLALRMPLFVRTVKRAAETALSGPWWMVERCCRVAYRQYLRRRAARWASPEQVVLADSVLKLHTNSHRRSILSRFDAAVRSAAMPHD
jgi:hypothetical protein